jgi:hypothetical protein
MTYGEKYFELTKEFIDIQDRYISAIGTLYRDVDLKMLSTLMAELREVQQEINSLMAAMKNNKLSLVDEYRPLFNTLQERKKKDSCKI